MGWHNYQNAWVHVDDDEDLSDPQVAAVLKRARNEVDQLLEREILVSNPGQEYPDLTLRTPEEIWQEYLRGVPGSGIYSLQRPGRYEIKIMEGMPVIYIARRGQIVRKPREHIIDRYLPLRQPVPCYDLHDNDVFQGFLVCGLNGNRWSHPHAWQLEDPDLPYSEEEVELSFPGPLSKGTIPGPGEGMLTEFMGLDVISEKDGRIDETSESELINTCGNESHWYDERGTPTCDYLECPAAPIVWPGFGELGWPEYNPDWGSGYSCGYGCQCTGGGCGGFHIGPGGTVDDAYGECSGETWYYYDSSQLGCCCTDNLWANGAGLGCCFGCSHGKGGGGSQADRNPYDYFCYLDILIYKFGYCEWWRWTDICTPCSGIRDCTMTPVDLATAGSTGSRTFQVCHQSKDKFVSWSQESQVTVDGKVRFKSSAWYTKTSRWDVSGCDEVSCTQSEMYEEHGTSFLVEDYAVVAPGFEDRGYKSGDNWMALIHEFVYDNKYNIVEAPHWVDAAHHSLDACFGNHTRPYVFVYPYRWSIAFDDGTSWIIHDPGTDQDAVWTDTFKIYDFHGKPVYIGGIFIMVDNGNAPSKRIYFMYYEGKFYLEEGVEPDHNCIWFGCYEHDVYGTAEGLDLALNREDEPAQGYGNGKCRAVGKYDSLWTQHSVNAGEEITEEV